MRLLRRVPSLALALTFGFGAQFQPDNVRAQIARPVEEPGLARLATAVQAEESIRAIKRLQYTYSHYLNAGLWNDLGDLFTEQARGQFPEATISGKDNLRRYFMAQAGRKSPGLAKGQLNEHLLLQPIITLAADGRSGKGAWHEVAMSGRFGGTASWAGGVHENEYVLDRGVWKIGAIHFYQQYYGDYPAFGHSAPAKWNIPYHFVAAHVGVTIPASLLHTSAKGAHQTLAQLARRVQRITDEQQVQNLQHAYGYYLDRKMWDDMADLFAVEGTLDLGVGSPVSGQSQVRPALEAVYGHGPLQKGELFDHVNLDAVVTIAADGRSAGARTSQLSMLGLAGAYQRWELGTYENQFIKQGGIWRLRAVHYYPQMATDYDKGWARDAFGVYPNPQIIGFHYPNPVTGRAVRYPAGAVAQVDAIKRGGPPSTPAPAATLADVSRQLDRAIGFDAVENLNSSYGYYIDESAWDNMADTYAKDGSKEITGVGVYVGPDRIRRILNMRGPTGGRTPSFYTIHQLTQPLIDVSADGLHANGRFRLFQMGGNADGSSGSWIGGIYENTAAVENGEWKFGRQELYHIFNASYRNGWARVGALMHLSSDSGKADNPREHRGGGITQGLGGANAPTSKFAADFPPDRLIQVRQYAFPDIVEPPFHYRNPVSGRMPLQLVP